MKEAEGAKYRSQRKSAVTTYALATGKFMTRPLMMLLTYEL